MIEQKIKWQDPLKFAEKISCNYAREDWIFLYSSLHKTVKNSISYIALFPKKKIICDDFSKLDRNFNEEEYCFGYLSYELSQQFEKLPKTKKSFIDLPKIYMINFNLILKFDHDKKELSAIFSKKLYLDKALKYKAEKAIDFLPKIKNLKSNFTDKSYILAISQIKKMIENGDFYQANLTRKFFGNFAKKTTQKENFQLFKKLTESSSANYASFLNFGENYIISSSPELFLQTDKNRNILSRPIKGTAARFSKKSDDKKSKSFLKNSEKETAENLMIVDLVRNDLSRICKASSVKVKNLFKLDSYKTVHHLSSEIYGKMNLEYGVIDALKATFPAGSMTGAPKIKAMEVIAKEEKMNRGIYSGAIGYINGLESNFSVVIRTLILSGDKFEFQAGGAITFESDPELELKEMFDKLKAIQSLLKYKLTQ